MNYEAGTPPGSPTVRFRIPPASPAPSSTYEPSQALLFPPSTPYWRILLASGKVRPGYAIHTPEDVEKMDDLEVLFYLEHKYCPTSQYSATSLPQTQEEESYLNIMSLRVFDKLYRLLFA